MKEYNFIHEEKQKFYLILLHQNPRGEHIIFKNWGSINKKLGGITTLLFTDVKSCNRKLKEILKKRIRNGYKEVQACSN